MSRQVLIDHGRFLEALRFETDLLVGAAHDAQHGTPVPSCPGLLLGEVLRHLGSLSRVVRGWLLDGRPPEEWQSEPVPGQPLAEYLGSGMEALLSALSSRDPSVPAETWWPGDPTWGFWQRRLAHEATVHRADVQGAAGVAVTAVAEDLAVDGIDEALHLWLGYRLGRLGVTATRPAAVTVEAGGQAWRVYADRATAEVHRVDDSATVSADGHVSGVPMQVYLWLWGRAATSTVTTEGDEDAIAQLWALLRLATR